MTETGQNNLDQRLLELESKIESYKKSLGIPKINIVPDEYLTASQDEMKGMPKHDCICAAIQLEQFAFSVQEELNKINSIILWAESNIKSIIADKLNNYSGYSYEERKNKAIKDSPVCMRLDGVRVEYQVRKTTLDNLVFIVNNMARYYNEMGRLK
jgi:hypothetical protein